MGFRSVKSTQENTNFQKRIFDKQLRDHYRRYLKENIALKNHKLQSFS